MKMKTKLILLITTILLLKGCGKQFCPGFPDEYADYLPYTDGQKIVFANKNNDTVAFQIYDFYQSEYNEISMCDMCECGLPMLAFHATPITRELFFEEISIEIELINPKLLKSYVRFKYDETKLSPDDCFGETNSIESATDTIIVNKSNPTRISKVLIIKGKGLASFYDITTNSEWKLIEK